MSTWFPALLPAVVMSSCGGERLLETTSTPFEGPRIETRVVDGLHRIVVHAPSPGWGVSLEAVDVRERSRDAFITIERPNPAFMYPQQIVEQQIATGIDASLGIVVFARVVEFGTSKGVYAPVETTTGGPPPTAPIEVGTPSSDTPGD
ncbi:MAG: hypothetical protein KDA28_10570 [Phycisphaerales bacterium]|nr:hypothetical protein [Phycisphaerales bacterium]